MVMVILSFLVHTIQYGSIYMSVNNIDPSTFFGGTWEQIKDVFLLSAGDTYKAGATGGEAKHTLTVAEMPKETLTTPINVRVASGTISAWDFSKYGGGQAHNNMPPYLVIYVWKRIA